MADLVLLTPRPADDASAALVLPGLPLLPHRVSVSGMDVGALLTRSDSETDLVLVDATADLVQARGVLRSLAALGLQVPVLAVVGEGALAVLDEQWPLDDLVLATAGPAELAARLRLALGRGPRSTGAERAGAADPEDEPEAIRVADVVVDEASWTVRAGGRALDLTFKEFELLRYLVQHPGRVVTRDTLLQQVWGGDYYGGTRTVDVHIRRLRAKLGPERESLIGTIRGVGYRFVGARGPERPGSVPD
ncbi:GlnR-family transcriptional regulator [Serinicoccus hydrothermalis]|uniref:GlnR-family transcriptional regulator n=1 Tax=Serinicoccus hydrothermalis TaxID=1758689 RepID=A0A1B1NEY1_9MICO|nr:response regulator transcription factor [Serinicoccus hydrothermalis]ANS79990.1 GlnR-family transcriptional regulator [Serinicoccus hydrothermalis]